MMKSAIDKNFLYDSYKSLFEFNPDASYALDPQGNFILFNDSALKLTGYTYEEFRHFRFDHLLREDNKAKGMLLFESTLQGNRESCNMVIRNKNQEDVELYITAVPIVVDNRVQGIIGFAKDMTQQNTIQHTLAQSQVQLENIFNNIDVCLWSWDSRENRPVQISPACKAITGYSKEEFEESPFLWKKMVHPHDQRKVGKWEKLVFNGRSQKLEYRILSKSGEVQWITNNAHPVFDSEGQLVRIDGVITDVNQRRKAEEELNNLAYYDFLTKLPNRRMLENELTKSIKEARKKKEKVLVLYLDLDRFKYINDSLGHSVGDELLKIVAQRLTGCLRKQDLVSRQGGDEFTIIVRGETELNEEQIRGITTKILEAIQRPIKLNDMMFNLSTSIGISVFPDHAVDADQLLMKADEAMYLAKEQGKNSFHIYNAETGSNLSRTFILEQGLNLALENNEITLNYQPIIHTDENKIIGFETLVRWNHPEYGWVSPAEFIPVAEECGLIIPIGDWILKTAISNCKAWHEKGFPIYVSVNVSAKQLDDQCFVEKLKIHLTRSNFNPEYLKIEITESTAMTKVEEKICLLQKLEELGVDVFLDDFGTGYSSLSYLKRFPLKVLKVDQSFVRDINSDANQEVIIQAIIGLATSLNMDVIAEGVETKDHLKFLIANGCYKMQGYYYSKPIRFGEAEELLALNWGQMDQQKKRVDHPLGSSL